MIHTHIHYMAVPSNFYMTGVVCLGTESSLLNCKFRTEVNCNRQVSRSREPGSPGIKNGYVTHTQVLDVQVSRKGHVFDI